MQSMTGYGRGSAALPQDDGSCEVVVEIRTVNHRFLDTRLRLSSHLNDQASTIDEVLRKRVARGHVEFSARVEGAGYGVLQLDKARARAALTGLSELQAELGRDGELPWGVLSAVPDLFSGAPRHDRDQLSTATRAATEAACQELNAMRVREGQALAADLGARVERVRALVAEIAPRCGHLVDAYRTKLHARIERLLAGTSISVDSGRLELEVALLADKSDISEELTRLDSHAAQVQSLLAKDEPVGRKLEFLLQELGREVNTIGSKVSDVTVTNSVLALKAELERMREQVQNVL